MRYWLDTEFIESGPSFPIHPLSIGIVSEDGREFYGVFERTAHELAQADEFVCQNVFPALGYTHGQDGWRYDGAHKVDVPTMDLYAPPETLEGIREGIEEFIASGDSNPEFWGYYADYDHVVFCQIWGRMVNLPTGFPKFCMDIKQWCQMLGNPRLPEKSPDAHHALVDARWNKKAWTFLVNEAAERENGMHEKRWAGHSMGGPHG